MTSAFRCEDQCDAVAVKRPLLEAKRAMARWHRWVAHQGIGATRITVALARDELAGGRILDFVRPPRIEVVFLAVTPMGSPHPLAQPLMEWVRTLL